MAAEQPPNTVTSDFAVQVAELQPVLSAYIRRLLPFGNDAAEILQRTNVVLLRKFSTQNNPDELTAIACRVAYFEVKAWRSAMARSSQRFSDQAIEELAAMEPPSTQLQSDRLSALLECQKKLGRRQIELLKHRYESNMSSIEIAQHLDKTPAAIRQMLARIRSALRRCIAGRLAGESMP